MNPVWIPFICVLFIYAFYNCQLITTHAEALLLSYEQHIHLLLLKVHPRRMCHVCDDIRLIKLNFFLNLGRLLEQWLLN